MNYRIKNTIYKNGNSCYQVQRRFLYIWMDVKRPSRTYNFPTLPQAEEKMDELRNIKVINIIYYY